MSPPLDNVIRVLETRRPHHRVRQLLDLGPATYQSSERITVVATDIGPTGQMLEDKVRRSKLPAYVFFTDDPFGGLEALRTRVAEIGVHLKEIPVDGKFVVVEPDRTMIAPPAWEISSLSLSRQSSSLGVTKPACATEPEQRERGDDRGGEGHRPAPLPRRRGTHRGAADVRGEHDEEHHNLCALGEARVRDTTPATASPIRAIAPVW